MEVFITVVYYIFGIYAKECIIYLVRYFFIHNSRNSNLQ
jgi:hypothetical protein